MPPEDTNTPEQPVTTPEPAPQPEPTEQPKPVDDQPTFTVKVDGQEMEVTKDELVSNFQLARASQKRMQEAAEARKQMEEDVYLAQLAKKVFTEGDEQSAKELMAKLNLDPSQLQEMAQVQNDDSDDQTTQQSAPDEETRRFIEQYKQDKEEEQRKKLREEIFSEAEKTVDTDAVLGKIENERVKARMKQHVRNEVQRRVGTEQAEWPGVLEEIIPEARKVLEDFGSLGRSGTNDTQVGFAGAPTPESGPQPKEPPKIPSFNDPEFETAFGKALRHETSKLRQRKLTPQQAMK